MSKNTDFQLGATEQKLQDYILSQYKSLREFCMQIDRPYSTISNMLKRGILNCSVGLFVYVVDRLGLDIDELLSGNIVLKIEKTLYPEITQKELNVVRAYRNKTDMQAAVDRLLDIESGQGIAEDIKNTVEQGENTFKGEAINAK